MAPPDAKASWHEKTFMAPPEAEASRPTKVPRHQNLFGAGVFAHAKFHHGESPFSGEDAVMKVVQLRLA